MTKALDSGNRLMPGKAHPHRKCFHSFSYPIQNLGTCTTHSLEKALLKWSK